MRSIVKVYVYECDWGGYNRSCDEEVEVTVGDAIPKYKGATWPDLAGKVRTAEDADKVMKLSRNWYIARNYQTCPTHRPDNEDDS